MSIGKVFALFLFSTVVAAAATCGGHGTQESLIVSTGWLANHMKDANLVLLAVGDKSDYDAEHIAGSQFIEYRSVGVKGVSGLTLEPDDIKALKSCREGDCDVQLPATSIRAFRDAVTHASIST